MRPHALKIFPDAFAADPNRLARFTREAQILASLNHPNIAAIYGIEESEGTRALVLELVEGPTLADRIAKGPIPLDDAGNPPSGPVSRTARVSWLSCAGRECGCRGLARVAVRVADDLTRLPAAFWPELWRWWLAPRSRYTGPKQ